MKWSDEDEELHEMRISLPAEPYFAKDNLVYMKDSKGKATIQGFGRAPDEGAAECAARLNSTLRGHQVKKQHWIAALALRPPKLYEVKLHDKDFGLRHWGTTNEKNQMVGLIASIKNIHNAPPAAHLFIGPNGCGKTHAAWAAAMSYTEAGHHAKVAKLADIIRWLREAWDRHDDKGKAAGGEDGRIERLRSLDFLAIDEVTISVLTDSVKTHLYDVVDSRIENEKTTVLTSHEDLSDLSMAVGPALMSRVFGSGRVWQFPSGDYRLLYKS